MITANIRVLITARKRSLRRLCFYTCLSFILFTGGRAWLLGGGAWLLRGACMVDPGGGMCGCSGGVCMVDLGGGHVWLIWGGMCGCSGGHAWLLPGGACVVAQGILGFSQGGMHGCSGGGVRGIRRDTQTRSMSGRYASYWNAFLFFINSILLPVQSASSFMPCLRKNSHKP